MRILLLSNLYPPYVEGGAEILAGDIAGGLEKLGHEVLVLTSWYGLPKAQQDGQVWRTLRTAASAHFDRRRSIWQQFNKLSNFYLDYHNAANAQELRRVLAATKPDALYIWEVNGTGIDARFLALPPRGGREASQLLYVGRLCTEKGILLILKALDVLVNDQHRTGLHLNIFGDGDEAYVNELRAFIDEKRLAQSVTFHGRVPQDELISYYDRAQMLLVPSLWQEPFGLVIAEAMARALPVIASDVGGPAEIITHGVDGLLVTPGDEQALVSAITSLLEDEDSGRRLSEAAQATVRQRFTVDGNVKRVEQHLLYAIRGEQVNREPVGDSGTQPATS